MRSFPLALLHSRGGGGWRGWGWEWGVVHSAYQKRNERGLENKTIFKKLSEAMRT